MSGRTGVFPLASAPQSLAFANPLACHFDAGEISRRSGVPVEEQPAVFVLIRDDSSAWPAFAALTERFLVRSE